MILLCPINEHVHTVQYILNFFFYFFLYQLIYFHDVSGFYQVMTMPAFLIFHQHKTLEDVKSIGNVFQNTFTPHICTCSLGNFFNYPQSTNTFTYIIKKQFWIWLYSFKHKKLYTTYQLWIVICWDSNSDLWLGWHSWIIQYLSKLIW